ncbi:MAG: glycosyltransferase [Planctomycetia bacterium]|nr:MAG: glycosyltransferase [Planctomycetia bacterium]
MDDALFILILLYFGGVLWLTYSLFSTIFLLRQQQQIAAAPRTGRDWPTIDVLVPVKDEADTIGACLQSILDQDYRATTGGTQIAGATSASNNAGRQDAAQTNASDSPPDGRPRLLVVNDRSTDNTAAAVQAVQDAHPHVKRLDIRELPEGLYGKPHALHALAPQLRGDVLAFVDSDLHLEPHCLRTLTHHLLQHNLDWVATMGRPEISRFWERLLVPLLGAITFAWYDPRKISDPAWPNAVGSALMICRASAYRAIGGHRAVINIYDEDSELIRIAKRAGQRVSFVMVPELFRQRHYGTLKRTIHGITRTLVGGLKTLPRIFITINSMFFVSVLPMVLLGAVGIAAARGATIPHGGLLAGIAALHLVVSTALIRVVHRTAGTGGSAVWLHPLGTLMMTYICLRAAVHLLRGARITWRGTSYERSPA